MPKPVLRTLLAALGLLTIGAGPAVAADDAPWQVKTASNVFGANRQNYTYTLPRGGQVKDAFVVVNRGNKPLDLAVYAADAFTTTGGQLDLLAADDPSKDVGSWVHAEHKRLKIQPGQTVQVPFRLHIPDNARPGDHLGGIVTAVTQTDATRAASVNRRLAIRIKLRVSGELKPGLTVEDLKVRYSGTAKPFGAGDATVDYTIRNTGNAIASARQTASISAPFGQLHTAAGPIDDSPQLLPGETWKVSVPIHRVTPAGRLTATVDLLPLVTDTAGSTATLPDTQTRSHTWAIPWTLVLLLLITGVAVSLLLRLRLRPGRRRRRRATGRPA